MVGLVSRYNGLYRDQGGLEAAGLLYCNTPWCIVTEGVGGKATCVARQATTRPCLRAAQGHDTTVPARGTRPRHGSQGLRHGRPWAAIRQGATGTTQPQHPRHDHARVRLGAPVCAG